MDTPNRRFVTPLLALALGLCTGLFSPQSDARSLRECGRSIRVGSQLVMAGDDAYRAQKLFSRNPQWSLIRRSKKQAVWRRDGRSRRSVRLTFKEGRVEKVCQID